MVPMAYDKGSLLSTVSFLQPLNPFSSQENHRFSGVIRVFLDLNRTF